jgi:DNA-binding CsgD family transcriptional regulator
VTGADLCCVALRGAVGLEVKVEGASPRVMDHYLAYTADHPDPLLQALDDAPGVVRSSQVFGAEAWLHHPFYQRVLEPFGIAELMLARLFDVASPCGAIAVGRLHEAPCFSAADALHLHILSLHASLATTRINQSVRIDARWQTLSAKQQRIISMVANGLTNDEIAAACGMTLHAVKKTLERLFARFQVSSRAELVATLGVRAHEK